MNKNNKILLGVLAFVVACTIGYALFSDNINITGTATAKGDFALTTTCSTGISNDLKGTVTSLLNPEGGYENDTCTVTGDEVSFHSDLLYPTASRWFTIKITNTGSIPAMLKLASDSDNSVIYDLQKVCTYEKGNDVSLGCFDHSDSGFDFGSYMYFVIDFPLAANISGQLVVPTDESTIDYLTEKLYVYQGGSVPGDLIIEPGVSVYFAAYLSYPSDFVGNGETLFKSEFKLRLNFVQKEA